MWQTDPLQFLLAIALDLLLGDPQGWPHIARIAGGFAAMFELLWSRVLGRTVFSGFVLWASVCGSMLGGYFLMRKMLASFAGPLGWLWDAFIIYQSLAARDLDTHARAVFSPLKLGDLNEARLRVGYLVGRDTYALDTAGISRAAVEAVAESATDGFVAPLFWAAIGGAPAALLYRTANTLDSIVGHRNERYELLGKFSARMDDVLGFLPARLCALASLVPRAFRYALAVVSDASKHASPNAGWSEAAAAWALNLRLGGTNFYDGVPHSGPVFNPNAPAPKPNDILRVLRWFWGVAFLCVVLLASGVALRVHSIPKPESLPPVPPDVPMPVLKTDFTTQPAPPPVKLKGEISYERKSRP